MNPYPNRYNELLGIAARELNIAPAPGEPPERWAYRVLYSMTCRMAYASLFDEPEETSDDRIEDVSTRHFKTRFKSIRSEYLCLFPEVSAFLSDDSHSLSDEEIYDLYLRAGYFYHTLKRISRSTPSCAVENRIRFERGMPLCRPQRMSGAGMYTLADTDSAYRPALLRTPGEMFGLPRLPLKDQWTKLLHLADWRQMPDGMQLEYLPEKPPFFRKFWRGHPVKDTVSVCAAAQAETGAKGPASYYLYDTRTTPAQLGCLPEWLTHDPHFQQQNRNALPKRHPNTHTPYRLINACLAAQGKLPPVLYSMRGSVAELSLQYILPPAEETFLQLYSWPVLNQNGRFRRWITVPVFESVRAILESLGYAFAEKERI